MLSRTSRRIRKRCLSRVCTDYNNNGLTNVLKVLSRLAACTILKALKTPAGQELTDQKKEEETAGLFHFSSNSQGRGFVVVWFCLQNGVKV